MSKSIILFILLGIFSKGICQHQNEPEIILSSLMSPEYEPLSVSVKRILKASPQDRDNVRKQLFLISCDPNLSQFSLMKHARLLVYCANSNHIDLAEYFLSPSKVNEEDQLVALILLDTTRRITPRISPKAFVRLSKVATANLGKNPTHNDITQTQKILLSITDFESETNKFSKELLNERIAIVKDLGRLLSNGGIGEPWLHLLCSDHPWALRAIKRAYWALHEKSLNIAKTHPKVFGEGMLSSLPFSAPLFRLICAKRVPSLSIEILTKSHAGYKMHFMSYLAKLPPDEHTNNFFEEIVSQLERRKADYNTLNQLRSLQKELNELRVKTDLIMKAKEEDRNYLEWRALGSWHKHMSQYFMKTNYNPEKGKKHLLESLNCLNKAKSLDFAALHTDLALVKEQMGEFESALKDIEAVINDYDRTNTKKRLLPTLKQKRNLLIKLATLKRKAKYHVE